ncbi:MAG: sigma 54-interacting transcriptional regulator [Deltaproteobacteria bacterium]|nr:sigma 54-interacting transcriptional regulator [Deltaproteobacteria bacterium]
MDENTFFRKATLLICSSLDIETALWRCREFLSRHIPADEISLNIYEPDERGLRYLARANKDGGKTLDWVLKLPSETREAIDTGRRLDDYLIFNEPETDPIGRIIIPALGLEGYSFIALRLRIEGHRVGVADLFAKGKDRFTPEHAHHFSLLREPFAIAMANALRHQEVVQLKEQLASDNRFLTRQLQSQVGGEIVGSSDGLRDVMEMVRQVAPLNNTVLLLGETGVGKEVIANAIHRYSKRSEGPFITVNCGAIPESLIDSELFGHEKGAFTGAMTRKRGRFERANSGTIFLDEIGELPAQAQVRLLRVLQSHEIERVGGTSSIPIDIRVIVATHRNLETMVASKEFREDLWYRINVFPIHIPPLRQRKSDIPALVQYFVERKSGELGIRTMPGLAPGAIERLSTYNWPGNVRELENVVERALIQHRSGPLFFNRFSLQPQNGPLPIHLKEEAEPLSLDEVISRHIEEILILTGGKINGPDGAAAILSMNPSTLRNRMKRMGIDYGKKRGRSGST